MRQNVPSVGCSVTRLDVDMTDDVDIHSPEANRVNRYRSIQTMTRPEPTPAAAEPASRQNELSWTAEDPALTTRIAKLIPHRLRDRQILGQSRATV